MAAKSAMVKTDAASSIATTACIHYEGAAQTFLCGPGGTVVTDWLAVIAHHDRVVLVT